MFDCFYFIARTPIAFLSAYSSLEILFPGDQLPGDLTSDIIIEMFDGEMTKLSTLCLLDIKYKKYLATDIAGSLIYLFRDAVGIKPIWREELTSMTYSNPSNDIMQEMITYMRNDLKFDSYIYTNNVNNCVQNANNTSQIIQDNSSSNNNIKQHTIISSPTKNDPHSTPQRPIAPEMQSPVNLYMQTLNITDVTLNTTTDSESQIIHEEEIENNENLSTTCTGTTTTTTTMNNKDGNIESLFYKRTSPVSIANIDQIIDPNASFDMHQTLIQNVTRMR